VRFSEARLRASNHYWERNLGISTRGTGPIEHSDSEPYATMSYRTIWPILDHLAPGPSDVLVDIGSGKGRVLCCAARYPVARVIGVDFSAPLCETARGNAGRMRDRRAPIVVHTGAAEDFDYSEATVLFLFNPFGAATLASVLEKVREDVGGSLRIAYAQTTHDDLFQQQPWLEQTDHWEAPDGAPDVSFYRSR
jgi:precorrin-6B methylase 2